jgi:hypothetical protein
MHNVAASATIDAASSIAVADLHFTRSAGYCG